MFESKYSKVLTVILAIVIIAILGLLGFLGYDYYQKYAITKDTSEFVDNFQGEVVADEQNDGGASGQTSQNNGNESAFAGIQDANNNNNSEGSSGSGSGTTAPKKKTYQGFGVLGTIEIPATGIKYPVLEKVTKRSIEVAVAFLYGTGLNQPGNSVIIGHNYRNGLFFSNNSKLNQGDAIYITDNDGNRLTYKVYKKFEAAPEDTSFYQRDTGGKPEITLSTCTENVQKRLIILARVE